MNVQFTGPTFSVVGSADDKDATNGPGKSYGPENKASDSVVDGLTQATSTCASATKLTVEAIAQTTKNSHGSAYANAKCEARCTLVVAYSFFDYVELIFGRRQEVDIQVVVKVQASVNDGPCGSSFSLFMTSPTGGSTPVPSWTGTYSCAQHPGDATKIDVTRANGVVETVANGGTVTDWADPPAGGTLPIDPGTYNLVYELNGVATADGNVTLRVEAELFIVPA